MLTELHTLTQIENQILQLQNQAQMLLNQAKNLQGLNFTSLARLEATFSATEQLLDQAQGMTFNLAATQQQLARVYPAAYGSAVTRSQLDADQLTRWSSSLDALDTAMEVQAQAKQNFPSDEAGARGCSHSEQLGRRRPAGDPGDQRAPGASRPAGHAEPADRDLPGSRQRARGRTDRRGRGARSGGAKSVHDVEHPLRAAGHKPFRALSGGIVRYAWPGQRSATPKRVRAIGAS